MVVSVASRTQLESPIQNLSLQLKRAMRRQLWVDSWMVFGIKYWKQIKNSACFLLNCCYYLYMTFHLEPRTYVLIEYLKSKVPSLAATIWTFSSSLVNITEKHRNLYEGTYVCVYVRIFGRMHICMCVSLSPSLRDFEGKSNYDVLQSFHSNRKSATFEHICEPANLVLAIPATMASVERNFSALTRIKVKEHWIICLCNVYGKP
jgi:hypothetical protein